MPSPVASGPEPRGALKDVAVVACWERAGTVYCSRDMVDELVWVRGCMGGRGIQGGEERSGGWLWGGEQVSGSGSRWSMGEVWRREVLVVGKM